MATAMIAKCECGAALWQPPSKRGYTWKPLLAAVWPSPRSRYDSIHDSHSWEWSVGLVSS